MTIAAQIGVGDLYVPTDDRQEVAGTHLNVEDTTWGGRQLVYGRATATIRAYAVCTLVSVWDTTTKSYRFDMTEAASTANTGKQVVIAMADMTTGQYCWFITAGTTPVISESTIAANDPASVTATGELGAVSAGKQVLGITVSVPATMTLAKTGVTASAGTYLLNTPESEGWFVGIPLSGTGIASGTIVKSIDANGHHVTISAATTAAINGTVTGTFNDGTTFYNVVNVNNAFMQGAIT